MEYDHIIWYAKNGGFPFGALRESPIGVVTHDTIDVEFYDDTTRMLIMIRMIRLLTSGDVRYQGTHARMCTHTLAAR